MKKFIIGIDFSKETVDASIVQKEQPETLIAYKKFRNNLKGVDGLIAWAKSKVAQDGEIIFCGENTGTYSTRVRDNIQKSKEQKNIQPTKGGHKMVTC